MEEQFQVCHKYFSPPLSLIKNLYLCEYNTHKWRHQGPDDYRDYIFRFKIGEEYNASFMTYLGRDWYQYTIDLRDKDIITQMPLEGIVIQLIHPMQMQVGNMYMIHDITNYGTINRGVYRLKDIDDCRYYFSRLSGGETIFQHDILSEDKQMCKDRLFFEVHINREVIDEW